MPAAVAREERDLVPAECAQDVIVAGIAKRRDDVGFFLLLESGHGIQPTATNDSDFRFHV